MAASLLGRLALVTGGGSGIGRAVCQKFAAEGAQVAVVDINNVAAKETLALLSGDHKNFESDTSLKSSVDGLLKSVKDQFGKVPTIVVNSAGITRDNFMVKMDEQAFDDVIRVNLKGTFLVNQAAAKAMIDAGVDRGSIINLSSIIGKVGNMGQANYAASKAGVIGLTKSVAKEMAKFNIRCNAVVPGFIETPMVQSVPSKVIEKLLPNIPLGRLGKAEEIADMCVFLASDRSSYVTGTAIEVTGGLFM